MADRRELTQALLSWVVTVRLEAGVVGVQISEDMESPGAYNLVSSWRTRKDLEVHLTGPEFGVLLGALEVEGIHPLVFLTVLVGIGVAWLAPLYAGEIARGGRLTPEAATFGSLIYLALFPSLASYVFWNQAVGEVGPTRAGAFLHLMPAFGSLLAVLLLGESFRLHHLAGILLILAGVTLAGAPAQPDRPARGDGASG